MTFSPDQERAPQIHWESLFHVSSRFLREASVPVTIIAPFINGEMLRQLVSCGPVGHVVTSWKAKHLIDGASDLEAFQVAAAVGAKFSILDHLHAKLFVVDMDHALIGSANVTASALGLRQPSNLELMVELRGLHKDLKAFVCRVLIDASPVDQALYERYREWLTINPMGGGELLPPPQPEVNAFLISQLPATSSPAALIEEITASASLSDLAIHDIQLFRLDLVGDRPDLLRQLRAGAESAPFFRAILAEIDASPRGIHFGGFKQRVQEMCADVPLPYRSELTGLVQNLYRWITELFPDRYEVVRPRHSEVIRKRGVA